MKARYLNPKTEKDCQLKAVCVVSAAYLCAMNDKGLSAETLKWVCKKAQVYAEQMNSGELNLQEMCEALLEETGIAIRGVCL